MYQLYVGLKLHFNNPDYDWFKYNQKLKISKKAFESRNDKAFFYHLAKQENPVHYLVSLLIEDDFWIGDMVGQEQIYRNWQARIQSLSYLFKSDLGKMGDDIPGLFVAKQDQPEIIRMYMRKEISLESLVIMADLLDMIPYWDKALGEDMIWMPIRLRLVKYKPFLQYDKTRFRGFILDRVNLSGI